MSKYKDHKNKSSLAEDWVYVNVVDVENVCTEKRGRRKIINIPTECSMASCRVPGEEYLSEDDLNFTPESYDRSSPGFVDSPRSTDQTDRYLESPVDNDDSDDGDELEEQRIPCNSEIGSSEDCVCESDGEGYDDSFGERVETTVTQFEFTSKSERIKMEYAPSCGSPTYSEPSTENDETNSERDDDLDEEHLQSSRKTVTKPILMKAHANRPHNKDRGVEDTHDTAQRELTKQFSKRKKTKRRLRNRSKSIGCPRSYDIDDTIEEEVKIIQRVANDLKKQAWQDKLQGDGSAQVVDNNEDERADGTPFTNATMSPARSTRVGFTPGATGAGRTPLAARMGGAATRCSKIGNTDNRTASGRKNPQAKNDKEIRAKESWETRQGKYRLVSADDDLSKQILSELRETGSGSHDNRSQGRAERSGEFLEELRRKYRLAGTENKRQRENLHDPLSARKTCTAGRRGPNPIRADPTIKEETNGRTYTCGRAQIKEQNECVNTPCSARKPAIPRQMRSTACYRDGKLDVSIYGDQRLIENVDANDVSLTFIRRNEPPKPKIQEESCHIGETSGSGKRKVSNNQVLPPISAAARQANKQDENLKAAPNVKRRAAPTLGHKVLPPIKSTGSKKKRGKKGKVRADWPRSKVRPLEDKRAVLRARYYPQNFDIINFRAQWPPFNTHVEEEASDRFKKVLLAFPSSAL